MVVVLFCALCRLIWMAWSQITISVPSFGSVHYKLADFSIRVTQIEAYLVFYVHMSEATIDGLLLSSVKLSSFFFAYDATIGFIF